MADNERDRFIAEWEREARGNVRVLQSLPANQYDFRPAADWRSLGDLAWHLAEIENRLSHGVQIGKFDLAVKPPGIERPRTVEGLAPGYEQMHKDAVARIQKIDPADMDREITFFRGQKMRLGTLLWVAMLHHQIHHRGALVLMCRLAGGVPPGLFGPTREEMAAIRAGG